MRTILTCSMFLLAAAAAAPAQQQQQPADTTAAAARPVPPPPVCRVDLGRPGVMKDILSNALVRGGGMDEADVAPFLAQAVAAHATGDGLLQAAAERFRIDRKQLGALVEHWRHVNCAHAAIPGHAVPDALRAADAGDAVSPDGRGAGAAATAAAEVPVSAFARDVALHVVLHELGHAVIREFDLPVLGNEETMADAFATHLLTEHFPDRAVRALAARVRSLQLEADEVPRAQWPVHGEHDNDARRAWQIAALAVAADRAKFAEVAAIAGMSPRDVDRACDYGAEIHRAWRRTLAPLWMPAGKASQEARFRADEATRAFVDAGDPSLAQTIRSAIERFDWHSQVTVDFVGGAGGAAWSRSRRTITVHGAYLQRFVDQGKKAAGKAGAADRPAADGTAR